MPITKNCDEQYLLVRNTQIAPNGLSDGWIEMKNSGSTSQKQSFLHHLLPKTGTSPLVQSMKRFEIFDGPFLNISHSKVFYCHGTFSNFEAVTARFSELLL